MTTILIDQGELTGEVLAFEQAPPTSDVKLPILGAGWTSEMNIYDSRGKQRYAIDSNRAIWIDGSDHEKTMRMSLFALTK